MDFNPGDIAKALNDPQVQQLLNKYGGNNNGLPETSTDYSNQMQATGYRAKRKPIYKTPPVLILKKVIGLASGNTNYYATFKFYIQKPTLENPKTAVKLALQGAKGQSVFTMLDINEVGELMSYFEKCYAEGAKVVDAYAKLEEELQTKREQIEKDESNIMSEYAPQIAEVLEKSDIIGD